MKFIQSVKIIKICVLTAALFLSACATTGRGPGPTEVTPYVEIPPQATQSLTETKDTNESKAAHHFSLGQSFSLEGNADQAIEEYKLALVYDADSAVIHTRLAAEYVKKGLLTFAIEECKNAIRLDPHYTDARLLLAGLYGATKMLPEALEQYDSILKVKNLPVEARHEVYVFRGSLLLEEGRAKEALANLNALVKEDPESFMGHYYLGVAHARMENVEGAAQSLNQAIKLKPDFAMAALTLGSLYESKNKQNDALKVYKNFLVESKDAQVAARLAQVYIDRNDYKSALAPLIIIERLDPDNLNASVKVGLIYVELKDYKSAEKSFRNILSRNADAERVRFYLAGVYEELKNYESAIDTLKSVSQDSSAYPDAAVRVAYLNKINGDHEEASKWIDLALAKAPDNPGIHTFKASLIEEKQGPKEALASLDDVKDRFTADEKFMYYLGSLFDKSGQTEKALDAMKKILDVNPENANALNYIGYTLAVRGEDLDAAEEMIRRALAQKPEDAYVQDSLGYVLLKKGKTKEALIALERAARLKPDEGIIIEHLADAYFEMNLRSKALQKYVEASKLYEDHNSRSKLEQRINEIQGRPTNRIPAEAK